MAYQPAIPTHIPPYYNQAGYGDVFCPQVKELLGTAKKIADKKLGYNQPAVRPSFDWNLFFNAVIAALRFSSPAPRIDNSTTVIIGSTVNSNNKVNSDNQNIKQIASEDIKEKPKTSKKKGMNWVAIIIGGSGVVGAALFGAYKNAKYQNVEDVRYEVKNMGPEIRSWKESADPAGDLNRIERVYMDARDILSAEKRQYRFTLALIIGAVAGSALLMGGGILGSSAAITFGALVLGGSALIEGMRVVYNCTREDYTIALAERIEDKCSELARARIYTYLLIGNNWVLQA